MRIVIYLNKEKTSTHVIKPTVKFDGDVSNLVATIAPHNYGYDVYK